jgi:DNA-binding transcriptional regulator LsrR (DeoR family)
MGALGAALAISIVRRNDFLAVITGMTVAAAARALGLGG